MQQFIVGPAVRLFAPKDQLEICLGGSWSTRLRRKEFDCHQELAYRELLQYSH